MIKIDRLTHVQNKSYTPPAIVVELDMEVHAGTAGKGGDRRFNAPEGDVPPADPDALPAGG